MRLGRIEDRTRYVVGFAFNEWEDRILLIEKKHEPEGAGMLGTFNGIGGKCKPRESYDVAMIREFQQEAGILVPSWQRFAIVDGDAWRMIAYRSALRASEWRRVKVLGRSVTDEMVVRTGVRRVLATAVDLGEEGDGKQGGTAFYPDVPAFIALALNENLWRARAVHFDYRSM